MFISSVKIKVNLSDFGICFLPCTKWSKKCICSSAGGNVLLLRNLKRELLDRCASTQGGYINSNKHSW